MIRRTPLPPRTKPVRKANPKRRQSEFARCYHSRERVRFVKSSPCLICATPFSENAHIKTGGMGRKSDYTSIVPLCTADHRNLHSLGRAEFENAYRIDLGYFALLTERLWQEYSADTRATA